MESKRSFSCNFFSIFSKRPQGAERTQVRGRCYRDGRFTAFSLAQEGFESSSRLGFSPLDSRPLGKLLDPLCNLLYLSDAAVISGGADCILYLHKRRTSLRTISFAAPDVRRKPRQMDSSSKTQQHCFPETFIHIKVKMRKPTSVAICTEQVLQTGNEGLIGFCGIIFPAFMSHLQI